MSTTHAIVGSFVGVAVFAYGPAAVNWSSLGAKVVLPLSVTPLVSLALTAVLLEFVGRPNS